MRPLAWLSVFGCWLGCTVAAQAQAPSYTLDLAATPTGSEIARTVQDGVTLTVNILRSGDLSKPATVDLDLSAFTNEQSRIAEIKMSLPDRESERKTRFSDVPFTGAFLTANLHVPKMPAGGKATGLLILTQRTLDGKPSTASPIAWRLALTPAGEQRPATLVVTPPSATAIPVVRGWCLFIWSACVTQDEVPSISFQLHDKTGNWPIEGVSIRSAQGLKVPGVQAKLSNLISAEFDGKPAGNLFEEVPAGQRDIAERGQATVTLSFHNLGAGEYVFPLQFIAKNSGDDPSQRVTITLQVRESIIWAILVLVAAALVSFIATRIVVMLRLRAQFLDRVRAMRPYWLADEPPSLAVIWFRATLRQAEDLSNRYWLTGQSELDAKLTTAQGMLSVLTRVHEVRQRIAAILYREIRQRAEWKLDNIVKGIPATTLLDADVTRIRADLDKLDGWCDPGKMKNEYWADLLPTIESRLSEVTPTAFSEGAERDYVEKLKAGLQTALEQYRSKQSQNSEQRTEPRAEMPATVGSKEFEPERQYQRLTIMWQLRHRDSKDDESDDAKRKKEARDKLLELESRGDLDVEKTFAVIDDYHWATLKSLHQQKKLKIKAPTGRTIEAYEPVVFEFTAASNPELEGSFLVQKKLTYHWTIDVFDRCGKSKKPLHGVSKQPRMAQFLADAGRMKASVVVSYKGDECPPIEQATDERTAVRASNAFRVWAISERSDFWAFGVALLVSIIGGLSGQYFGVTFGSSFKDYLALFTWGASIDQGKNFIQALAAEKRFQALTADKR